MKTYTIQSITNELNWAEIPSFPVNEISWLPDAGVRMTQQICYDDTAIYIHQTAIEANIRAEHRAPLAPVYEDSCMEFFFSPMAGDPRYFNFEWNLNGCMCLEFSSGRENLTRLLPKDPITLFDFHATLTSDGWELFYKIPLSFIHLFFPEFQLKSGTVIKANCYKCGEKSESPHYLTWNPSTSATPEFHRPQDFGEMIFA